MQATPPHPVEPVTDADYRRLVDEVSDYAIFLLDATGHVRSWNPGAHRLKGYEAEEVIGRHFSMFYPAAMVERGWPAHELEVAQASGRFEDEGWRCRKDGSQFWANVIITRLLDQDGRLHGFSKITRDLTQRRAQEELLRESEERFRLLVESVQDYAIFMLDPDGHVLSWNAGAQNIKGYTAREILGRHFSVFYSPDVVASGWPARELEIARESGRVQDEGWRIRKDGSRFWASVLISALRDASGTLRGFAKITHDLTQRRRISKLEDEGRRMTTFLAMLGHELRNPLAPIANAVSILQVQDTAASPQVKLASDVIDRQLTQITRLVDDLLDVGRITSGKVLLDMHAVSLGETIRQAVESVATLLQSRQHTLDVHLPQTDVWTRGDRVRLVQIFSNLLNNAAKFTPPGGCIAIGLRADADRAEVSVKDNGPGIAPEYLSSIFNLFVQAPQDAARSQGGLGLGLSLVRQLVHGHEGDIAVFSTGEAGAGAEFVVRLPRLADLGADEPPSAQPAADTRKRILVVDDNADSANTLGLLIETLGYRSEVAYDGAAALEACRQLRPDLVLMDIGLPDLDGREVAARLQREFARCPVLIAVSGYGQRHDRDASLAAGFADHLSKPLRLADLQNLLIRWLADGAVRPP